MKISYAIPVCNEYKEIKYLLEYLTKYKREQDEIVVQCDQGNTTSEVYDVLKQYPNIKIIVPTGETIESTKHNTRGKDKISFDEVLKKSLELIK